MPVGIRKLFSTVLVSKDKDQADLHAQQGQEANQEHRNQLQKVERGDMKPRFRSENVAGRQVRLLHISKSGAGLLGGRATDVDEALASDSSLVGIEGEDQGGVVSRVLRRMLVRIAIPTAAGAMLLLAASLCCAPAGALAAESAEPCPNEAVRGEQGDTYLPDCRAYEMVTPPYKEGYTALLPRDGASYSSNGDQTILYSLGDLAETSGAGEQALEGFLYSDNRTPSGWQLSPLNAPLSQFVGEVPIADEAENGETLWEQHTPQQGTLTRDLYERSSTGSYTLIGPLGPSAKEEEASNVMNLTEEGIARVVGVTSNYEHVVLYAKEPEDYWPFDKTTGEGSLYEYTGTGNSQPILVGVSEGEKGSDKLISLCGTKLGGASSTYNALTADGEGIFFTTSLDPSCNRGEPAYYQAEEIYERLHGDIKNTREEASTVRIGESECTNECGLEISGKNFEGASENGERVFFTSTQKLTNVALNSVSSGDAAAEKGCSSIEAGAGGCNLYEYVATSTGGSHLETIASGEVAGVVGIAESGTRIYYVSRNEIPGSGKGPDGNGAQAGADNLYVFNTLNRATTFIAALGEQDAEIWQKSFAVRPAEVAGNEGQFLLFESTTPELGTEDTSNVTQLFEYDADTGELVRITKGEDGYNKEGNAVSQGISPQAINYFDIPVGGGTDFKSRANRLNISEDGKVVAFETAGQLSKRATSAAEGCLSVYEFRTEGKLSEGSVHLISDGSDTQPYKGQLCGAQFIGMDASGANILFATDDELLPSDTDGVQRDIYDAREEGGFPLAGEELGQCAVRCEGPSTGPTLTLPTSTGEPGEATLLPSSSVHRSTASPKRKTTSDRKKQAHKKRKRRGEKSRRCKRTKKGAVACRSTKRKGGER